MSQSQSRQYELIYIVASDATEQQITDLHTQVEEIELTFAAGLPLPRPNRGISIDNKYFKFRSQYGIKGQTLTVRREFISNVPGQVCGKEIEAELTEPMERVLRSLRR